MVGEWLANVYEIYRSIPIGLIAAMCMIAMIVCIYLVLVVRRRLSSHEQAGRVTTSATHVIDIESGQFDLPVLPVQHLNKPSALKMRPEKSAAHSVKDAQSSFISPASTRLLHTDIPPPAKVVHYDYESYAFHHAVSIPPNA
jgi:hypothetical protein